MLHDADALLEVTAARAARNLPFRIIELLIMHDGGLGFEPMLLPLLELLDFERPLAFLILAGHDGDVLSVAGKRRRFTGIRTVGRMKCLVLFHDRSPYKSRSAPASRLRSSNSRVTVCSSLVSS